jgi:hypothetical protein
LNLFEPFQTGLGPHVSRPSTPLFEPPVPCFTDWRPPPPRPVVACRRDPLHRSSMHRPTARAPPFLPLPTRRTNPPPPHPLFSLCSGKRKKGAIRNLLRLAAHPCQTHLKDPDASSSCPALVLPTTVAGAPLKPPSWSETSPLSPLHSEHRPLHAPSPLDQRITLFSSSLGYMNSPRSLPATTCLLRYRTPPPIFSSAASSTPGHLGEPLPSSPCRVPPNFITGASPGYPATFHPLPCHHQPCYDAGRARGDHAAEVHCGAGWHGPPWPIVAMGWAGQRMPGEPFPATTRSRPPIR